jgi:hypothetical protein
MEDVQISFQRFDFLLLTIFWGMCARFSGDFKWRNAGQMIKSENAIWCFINVNPIFGYYVLNFTLSWE